MTHILFSQRAEIKLVDAPCDLSDASTAGAREWLRDALAALRRESVAPTVAGLAATLASVRDARANLSGILSGQDAIEQRREP